MKFENKDLKVSFEVDDVITVPMQLMYWGMIDEAAGMSKFLKRWNAARSIISEWKCEAFKDCLASYSEETDPTVTAVIMWAAHEVYQHVEGLTKVPND